MDLDVYNCCLDNEWKVNDDRWTKRQTGVKLPYMSPVTLWRRQN